MHQQVMASELDCHDYAYADWDQRTVESTQVSQEVEQAVKVLKYEGLRSAQFESNGILERIAVRHVSVLQIAYEEAFGVLGSSQVTKQERAVDIEVGAGDASHVVESLVVIECIPVDG